MRVAMGRRPVTDVSTSSIRLVIDGSERELDTQSAVKENMDTGAAEHVLYADLDGCWYQGIGLSDDAALAALIVELNWDFGSVSLAAPEEAPTTDLAPDPSPFVFRALDLTTVAGPLDSADGPLIMA